MDKSYSKILHKTIAVLLTVFFMAFFSYTVRAAESSDVEMETIYADNTEGTEETTTAAAIDTAAIGTAVSNTWPAAPEIDAEAIYLIDVNNSCILNEKNSTQKMYPASTTKLLTCLLALENCSLDEIVTFSATAVALEEGDSNIGAVAGEQMTMRDVLYGLMVASGNECANAIAEHISGSNEAFAELMNARAAELGCTGTHFTNPSGLYDSNHYTTAEDLAKIALKVYSNSTFADIISTVSYTISPTNMDPNEKNLSTTVELIKPTSAYYNENAIGGKTGYLQESGRCLVAFAKKDGLTLISVLLNSGYETVFDETNKNFNYGFDNFSTANVSESESRFTYMNEKCKVYLDPKSQIITLKNISFDDLTATITYVSEMDKEKRAAVFEEIGMSTDSALRLYAELHYSYAGRSLGQVYVLIDPDKEITEITFRDVNYVDVKIVIICAAVVFFVVFVIIRVPKRRKRYR